MKQFTFLLFLIFSFHLHAQSIDAAALKLEVTGPYALFGTIPVGEKGLVFYSKHPGGQLHLEKYNTDLVKQISADISIPEEYTFKSFTTSLRFLHFIFANKKGDFIYYKFVLWDFKFQTIQGRFGKESELKEFIATDKFVYIHSAEKDGDIIRQINLNTFAIAPLEIESKEIKNVRINYGNLVIANNHVIFYGSSGPLTNKSQSAFEFNEFGELAHVINFPCGDEIKLQNIAAASLGSGVLIFTGTYTCKEFPQGIFICKTIAGKPEYYKQYAFGSLQSFIGEEINQENTASGKCSKNIPEFNFQIKSYPAVKGGNQLIYTIDLNEAGNFMCFDEDNLIHTCTSPATLFIAFDNSGAREWDINLSRPSDITGFNTATQIIHVRQVKNRIEILRCGDQKAQMLELNNAGEIISGSEDKISDNCRHAASESASHWYRNSFLFTGYSDTSVDGKLYYFITKLSI